MDKSKNPDSEADLLQQFTQSPDSAMEELMERYSGSVRATIERFLQDPEDVKECVNDTFMEFYRSRERYDPEKGSLSTYLTTIAKNQAISRFRKNAARPTAELPENVADAGDPIGDAERRADLEQALSKLSPEDAQMIRQKYYEGMTLQEIADAEDLPYDTVKKRHQRSLKKLRVLLITGLGILAAALLAACAYLVLRHFGVLPGYGMGNNDGPFYLLAEEASTEGERWTYTVKEAVMMEGTLRININIHFSGGDDAIRQWSEVRDQYYAAFKTAWVDDWHASLQTPAVQTGYGLNDNNIIITVEDGTLTLEGEEVELTLQFLDAEFPITMRRVEPERPENYHYALGDEGGVLAIPKRKDGELSVELYPLNTGNYAISPDLIYDAYRQGKTEDITITGKNGEVLTGRMSMIPNIQWDRLSVWEFGPAEPGDYVLHIPHVYLLYQVEEKQSIAVNLETCQWEDKDMEFPFGTISIVSCEEMELEDYPDAPTWRIVLEADTEIELSTPPLRVNIPGTTPISQYTALPDHRYELLVWLPTEEEVKELGIVELGERDPTQAQVASEGTVSLLWDQELTIPFTVE